MTEPKAKRVFYPFLFALFPALFLFSHNIEEAGLNVLPMPLIASLVLVILFWLPCRLLLRDRQKAGLLAFVFSFMFFSYGHVLTALFPKMVGDKISALGWTLWIWLVLFLALAMPLVLYRRSLNTLTALLNVFVTVLLLFSLWQIASFYLRSRPFVPRISSADEDRKLLAQQAIPRAELPDIYYLIFDRYASKMNLRQFFAYDNSPFYSQLEGREFYVAYKSRCNHPGTYLSLSSSLNMDLLPDLLGEGPVKKGAIFHLLQDSRVLRLVKALGYTYFHFGSWYEPTKFNRYADFNFPETKLTGLDQDFILRFLDTTPLAFLVRSRLSVTPHRENVLRTFVELARVTERPGPKFIFLHMLVPHAPYVFGANGEEPKIDKKKVEENYVAQLKFLNKKIAELLGVILSRSKIPPIIIIQSDEGPSTAEMPVNALGKLNKRRRAVSIFRIRCSILNAYLFPGKDKAVFYDSISPVNTFRLLFNTYFGTRYPLLPDVVFRTVDTKNEVLRFKMTGNNRSRPERKKRRGRAADSLPATGRDGQKKQELR